MDSIVQFKREDYLEHSIVFEDRSLTDADEELCEFNNDPESLASELAYTRYELAKAEKKLDAINELVREWG